MIVKKLLFSRFSILFLSYVSTLFLVSISGLALYAEIVFYLNTLNLMVLLIRGYSNDSILRLVANKKSDPIFEIIEKGKRAALISGLICITLYFLNFINYKILFVFLSFSISIYASIITSITSEVMRFKNKIFKAGIFSTNGGDIIALLSTITIIYLFKNNTFYLFTIFNSIFLFSISYFGRNIINKNFINTKFKTNKLSFTKPQVLEFLYSSTNSLQSWLITFFASNFLTKELGGQFLFLIKMSSLLSLGLTIGNYIFNSTFAKLYIEKNFILLRKLYYKRRNYSLIWLIFSSFILGLLYFFFPKVIIQNYINDLNYFFLISILIANTFYLSTGPCSSLLIMTGRIKSAFISSNISLLPYLFIILIIIINKSLGEEFYLITIPLSYSFSIIINNVISYKIANKTILARAS